MESKELQEALRVRTLLVKAIEEKGEDYVYPKNPLLRAGIGGPRCTYAEYKKPEPEAEGQHIRDLTPVAPSCIVGHVAYYAGLDLETLKAADVDPYSNGLNDISAGIGITSKSVIWGLRQAQTGQDHGYPWERSLLAYDVGCARIAGYAEAVK